MGWQDELRRLDEELAAGRLSAEEYRQHRDAILTSQAGQPSESGQPEGSQDSSPFPPPFKWDSEDVTTRMTPKDDVTTRMAPKPAAGMPSQGNAYEQAEGDSGQVGDAERTQVVHGPGAASGAVPPPNQPIGYSVPSWQQAGDQGRQAPPWAGQDLPPIGQEPTWLRQGPEAFDAERRSSGRMILIASLAVLTLLGGGAALYWFGFHNNQEDQPPATASSGPSSIPTTTTVPRPAGPFVELDGQIVVNDTYSMDDAAKANRPARTEIKTLTDGGTETVAGYVTETDGIRTGIWTFEPKSGGDAVQLLDAIDQLYRSARYQKVSGAPAGVRALYLPAAQDGSTPAVYRAHYLYKGIVVRVEVYGGNDPKSVEQKFNDLLGRQLKDFPASAT